MEPILLSTAFFAPVHYYARFIHHPNVYIEQFENFTKQTYRNRCNISGSNGIISLVAPVIKGRGPKMLIKDVQLSYDMDWQRNQWQTIVSAYNSSPYFEYYQDDIAPFFEKKFNFLLDYNMQIHKTICECLDIKNSTKLTTDFEEVPAGTLNFRDIISPKNKKLPDVAFQPLEYTQVFTEKFGFSPNLSILDLLFNEGPNTETILENSLKFYK
ncbi:WbqC family protein [uncultured Draconibacterium sp.]|uniref:WbqC family protein n=1 Tax=uncultured Draconibacterium sp. TaxID=1573823 RepID=UPI0032171FF1